MIAIYVGYKAATGQVTHVQAQYKGIAPKVADWPRSKTESVVRFSVADDTRLSVSLLKQGEILGASPPRTLFIGGSSILIEDTKNAVIDEQCIEKVPYAP